MSIDLPDQHPRSPVGYDRNLQSRPPWLPGAVGS